MVQYSRSNYDLLLIVGKVIGATIEGKEAEVEPKTESEKKTE